VATGLVDGSNFYIHCIFPFFTFVFLRLATRDFSYLWGQQQVFVVLSGRERDTQNYIYI